MNSKHFIVIIFSISSLLFSIKPQSFAQESRQIELKAQEIVAGVDEVLRYPVGLMRGNISQVYPDGKSFTVDVEGKISKDDFLFTFKNIKRGDQIRILYNLHGEDIWVLNMLSLQVFHKMDVDKFDSILQTNFSFIDISNSDFQSNFTASVVGQTVFKGRDVFVLNLVPISKSGQYGKIGMFVDKKNYVPLRIDYYDVDKVLMKTLTVSKTAEFDNRIFPIRYDMLHISSGSLTILQFTDIDRKVTFDKKIFFHENLGKEN